MEAGKFKICRVGQQARRDQGITNAVVQEQRPNSLLAKFALAQGKSVVGSNQAF